jgi:CubicO group peptidase (beta-lactamase class C family)
MTATLAGMLVEEGKLAWDTTLAAAFPKLAESMHPQVREVTLDQCLAHRGGFTTSNDPKSAPLGVLLAAGKLGKEPREERQKFLEIVLPEEPESEPGMKFAYSNRGYIVVGAMIEQAADMAWEDLIAKRLFEPLEMKSAGFGPMGKIGQLDQPRQHRAADGKLQPVEPWPFADNPPLVGPAGRVHCSLGDWAKYIRLHLAEEREFPTENGGTLLKPATIRRLHAPQFGGTYAGGWIIVQRGWGGGTVLNHAGSNTMNFAVAWVAPRKDFAILAATNAGGERSATACNDVATQAIGKYL